MKINHSDKKQNSVKMKSMLIGLGGLLMLGIIFSIIQLTTAAPDWPTVGHPWVDMQCDTNMCVSVANSQVGIGSTGPASKLHVKDGHAWGSDLSVDATGTTGGRRWMLISSGGTAGEGQGKFMIKDNTVGVRMTIDTAGNVGIGATSPSYKLDVSGTGRFTGALTLDTPGTLTSHAVRADRTISSGTGLSGGGNLTANQTISADTSYLQRRVTGTCSTGNAIRVINSDGTVTCQSTGGLPTGSSGQTLRYGSSAWEASSVIQNDGTNIGIGGAPSSARKLHIHGAMRLTGHLYDYNDSSGYVNYVLTRVSNGVEWKAASAVPTLTCTTVTRAGICNPAQYTLDCASGYTVTGGGISGLFASYSTSFSYPTTNGWACQAHYGADYLNCTCYARCCKL